ncbi:MAG: SprT-like domain-containing protein [Cyclobacteriaceae bacterium]|nr:SprT-like domain-containing protein [Cyclobacteriaceae bacterium]
MSAPTVTELLSRHIPKEAIWYCQDLRQRYPFDFKVRGARLTKAGDFTVRPGRRSLITVNGDLHPYLFLVTYIHEFSHHAVHMVYGNHVEPHGKEWKLAFRTFMEPLMGRAIFPPDLEQALIRHMKDPMASPFYDPKLMAAFRKHDPSQKDALTLDALPLGSVFSLHQRVYKKGAKRRSRYECVEIESGRKYLVPADAVVHPSTPSEMT